VPVIFSRNTLAVEALTLAAVVFYRAVAYCQWRAMIISNEQTKTALHVSERAYITTDTPIFDLTTKTLAFDITNSGHIPSGLIEIIAHESTSNATRATIPEIASAVEYHWKRHKVAALPPGKGLFSFLVPVHAFSEDKFKPDEGTYQLILVAGKISYYDGFPDDDRQEWLFCFQSVYHLDLKRIVFVYCDPERVIPQMENRDGYPRNEAAD
jgi:hypothetical protein